MQRKKDMLIFDVTVEITTMEKYLNYLRSSFQAFADNPTIENRQTLHKYYIEIATHLPKLREYIAWFVKAINEEA